MRNPTSTPPPDCAFASLISFVCIRSGPLVSRSRKLHGKEGGSEGDHLGHEWIDGVHAGGNVGCVMVMMVMRW